MKNNLTPELKAAFEAIIKAEPGSPDSAVGFLLNCMLKAHNYHQPLLETLTLQFEQIINNMPQEGQFTLHWLCELMGKARDMDRWVDVKERLPANSCRVLCCEGEKIEIARFWADTNQFYSLGADGFIKATHYQPLPNPPTKAVRKDGEG